MFIRHGEKAYSNCKGPLGCKQLDPPLTEKGRRQAREYFETLKSKGYIFKGIECSPMLRTRETAAIASDVFDVPIQVNKLLGEVFHYKHINMTKDDFEFETLKGYFPRVESRNQLNGRVKKILNHIDLNHLYIGHGYLITLCMKMSGKDSSYPGPLGGVTVESIIM